MLVMGGLMGFSGALIREIPCKFLFFFLFGKKILPFSFGC